MIPERWHTIEELFNKLAGRPAQEQAAELADVEPELRREVEKLLASDGLSLPGVASAMAQASLEAQALLTSQAPDDVSMSLATGTPKYADVRLLAGAKLGPYEVGALIGAGGMGDVYLAEDSRLGRKVALKVLSSALLNDSQFRARFLREARSVSRLSHPHICVLHDIGNQDGIDFLVMEYLEGETLEDRLRRGPIPLDQALRYAIEIADALDAAHRQGITHRDLKPANLILTKSGTKLLDFGLAKIESKTSVENAVAHPPRSCDRRHDSRHAPVHGTGAVGGKRDRRAYRYLRVWRSAF